MPRSRSKRPKSPGSATRRELFALGGLAAGASLAACHGPTTRAERPSPAFPELGDQRHTVEPISADERAARRARLAGLLAARGIDAYFCEGGATLAYLTGVSWGLAERAFGLMLFADGTHVWITPRFEAEKAALKVAPDAGGPGGELVAWEEDQYARFAFAELARRGVRTLALDPGTRLLVRDEASAAGFADEAFVGGRAAREVLIELRARKSAHELALLRRASELTQQAIDAAARRIEAGMRASDVAELVGAAQSALGLERPWVLALIGPAAAYPHGDDGGARLAQGDFLLVDTGGTLHGYQSDVTRTWAPEGRPSERALSIWHTVRAAQLAAFEAIRPGVPCAEIDRAAREVIDRAGFGPDYRTFTHRLGHGIGLEGHEDPYFDRGSQVRLEPGMTLSNEPGVYLYGELGVRLEDVVAVTAGGADHFGAWQAGPLSPEGEAR